MMSAVTFYSGCVGNVDLGKKCNFHNANKILTSCNSYIWSWNSLGLVNPFWWQLLVMKISLCSL